MTTSRETNPCPMCGSANAKLIFSVHFKAKEFSLVRCAQCRQHYTTPHPSAAEISEFYSGDYHAELREKGAAEKIFGPKFEQYRELVLQYVKGGRSLDIGTATGLFPSYLKSAGFEAEGIEFNEASAQWGRTNYGVKITTGSLEQSDLAPGSYDLISMTDVLEHMDHPLRYLEFVAGYLKPGGFMLVTFPDIASLESRYVHFLARTFHREWIHHRCTSIPGHIWEFTPATARAMFQKAGFEVRGFQRRQDPFQPSAGMLSLLLLPTRLLHLPPLDKMTGTQMLFVIQKRS